MKKFFITGAGGYIGSKAVEYFLEKGYTVVALDRYFFGDNLRDLVERFKDKLTLVKDDIRYFDKEILSGVETVIDFASISNDPSSELMPSITEDINFRGATRLAQLAKEMGVKKYIFSSSCSIYGASNGILTETSPVAPVSTYAKCKLLAENEMKALMSKDFSVTFMRNATVYGLSARRMRFDLIVNLMTLHAWKNKKIFIMGGGQQWRPLIHIMDLIRAFELVAEETDSSKINGQILNVGANDQNYQVFQVATMVSKFFPDVKVEVTPDDPDLRNYHVNFDKIAKLLNYKAQYTVDDGVVEVKEALEKGLISESVKTKTVEYYRYLLDADQVLSTVKLNNSLF